MDLETSRLLREDELRDLTEEERKAFTAVPDELAGEAKALLDWRDKERAIRQQERREEIQKAGIEKRKELRRRRARIARAARRRNRGGK